jgi:hypothetical protein
MAEAAAEGPINGSKKINRVVDYLFGFTLLLDEALKLWFGF